MVSKSQGDTLVMYQEELKFDHRIACSIVKIGKRRDGGTKYWCISHKADATAKYGVRAEKCRYSEVKPVTTSEIKSICVEDYPGGIALWGAMPPIFDTTMLNLDRGIHVHARKKVGDHKTVDATFRQVNLKYKGMVIEIKELDAIYFAISNIFGYEPKAIYCSYCGYSHLDRDWFSLHPHKSHLCSSCGKNFRDIDIAVGNPLAAIRILPFYRKPITKKSKKKLKISQSDYRGGIQIWGSNTSIFWNSRGLQESGIHVHAFNQDGEKATIDDTFCSVEIDGIVLDEHQVRTYMAQKSLPHLKARILCMTCKLCGTDCFDQGSAAISATLERKCSKCGERLRSSGKLKKVISNPMVRIIELLSASSQRSPKEHDLGLIPETL